MVLQPWGETAANNASNFVVKLVEICYRPIPFVKGGQKVAKSVLVL